MSHPAIDDADAERLKAQLEGRPAAEAPTPPPEPPPTATQKLKAAARRAAVPVVARLRQELITASAGDQADLRAQVAELREELTRTRAEHAAELAALHEELAARRRPAGDGPGGAAAPS